MDPIDRRAFLTISGVAVASTLSPRARAAGDTQAPPSYDDSVAVLYDATKCIGCRSCMAACRAVNDLEPELHEYHGVPFDTPANLSDENWTVIQLHRPEGEGEGEDPARWSFIKKNCMHCNVPACASACPVAALQKTDEGPVIYFEDRCIGCRYCLWACPYHVPRYEWVNRAPRVRKCDWNRACVRACPVGALIEGPRKDLVEQAHRRIDQDPARYHDHVYGEHEAGGASYLIIAGVDPEKLGLPTLSSDIRTRYADAIMRGLPGWIVGLGLALGGLYQMNKWQERHAAQAAAEEYAT